MSWGTELWDQYDQIAHHTQKGIDFLEKYSRFVDERCKIEQDYAQKLRRLTKNYLPKQKGDDYKFTGIKAFSLMLNEINDLAGQHELIAENLSTAVVADLTTLIKSLKDDRRKQLQEGTRIQALLTTSLNALTKTKEKYEKAFGASERALEMFNKADADMNLSRAEVDKHRMTSNVKRQQMDDAKNEYANQLQKTNDYQRQYYNHFLPGVFSSLQDLEEKRIISLKSYMQKSANIEQEVLPIVTQCLDGIQNCTNSIDEKQDTLLVIDKHKSGFNPPGDIPFEDLSNASSTTNLAGSTPSTTPSDKKLSILGTITGGKLRKRSGLLGIFAQTSKSLAGIGGDGGLDDFAELPPNQRRKKLQSKIDALTSKICQETAARDGLMKMKTVYEANPALGDPMSIQGQLTENGQILDKLRSDLRRYQVWLEECDARTSSPASSARTSPRRSSVSDDVQSLSRSTSDSSVNHAKNSLTSQGGRSSNSPESGIAHSAHSLAHHEVTQDIDDDEFYDVEPLPILGRCRGLYTFEASSEGSIPMEDGEELWLIEMDQGDGWTRVRRTQPDPADLMPEGFVPTSYIEIYDKFAQPQPV
eukprot:TRINITY_DN9894_c0_g1_i1.p1 TRINITY_DN9894_c0_g1~~TRINITY_DN9894_c0_g1_i1.p1  ORF type:complete len:588 (+),score=132.18 TRINITY_DN9894_c0_g1_i1:144-1907(+)